jgi:PIN domain
LECKEHDGSHPMINYDEYNSVVFIDAMVVLECHPLRQQPWKDVDSKGPILIAIVPQVQAAIDKRKRDFRLATKAREFNRLIKDAVLTQSATIVRDANPKVDLAMVDCGKINWSKTDLDRQEEDHVFVAQVLHAKGCPRGKALLLSHDINPIAVAKRNGVRVFHISDDWLLPPSVHPKEKENKKLQDELLIMRESEPVISIAAHFELAENLSVYDVAAPSGAEVTSLINAVLRRNPQKSRATYPYGLTPNEFYLPGEPSEAQYEKYRNVTIPEYASRIHESLMTLSNQIPFVLEIKNEGSVPAQKLIVQIDAHNLKLSRKFVFPEIFAPRPPKGRDPFAGLSSRGLPAAHKPVGPHEVVFGVDPKGGDYAEIHCEDFRHGRKWEFEGFVTIDPKFKESVEMGIRVTAANMHGQTTTHVRIKPDTKQTAFSEAYDLENNRILLAYPLKDRLTKALMARASKEGNSDWVKWPRDD